MVFNIRRARGIVTLVVVLLVSGCASDTGLLAGADRFHEFTDDIGISDGGTEALEQALEYYEMSGVTVIAFENGVISGAEFRGVENDLIGSVTDQHTVYQAASLSKMVAGLGMAKADRLGLIDLDTNIAEHVRDHLGDDVSGWYTREFLSSTKKRWAEDATLRRLLQSNAGMDRPRTGTACEVDDTAIANFIGTFSRPCIDCVHINYEPGTKRRYSSGGFVVAEAMFEEESGRGSRNFLNNDILEPYGLDSSTFKNAGSGIANLATACDLTIPSTGICACTHEIARVKFPGGLLANPLDYARLLMIIMHEGYEPAGDPEGDPVIPVSDIHEVLHPGYHLDSTLNSCSVSSSCSGGEQCIAGRCMTPLGGGDNLYGLGVDMKPTLAADGYPSELYHTGGQDGFSSYFNIDRDLRNGVLIFINGRGKSERTAFRDNIIDAFKRHYRSL